MPQISKGWLCVISWRYSFPPGRGLCPPGGLEGVQKRASRATTSLVTSCLGVRGEGNVSTTWQEKGVDGRVPAQGFHPSTHYEFIHFFHLEYPAQEREKHPASKRLIHGAGRVHQAAR